MNVSVSEYLALAEKAMATSGIGAGDAKTLAGAAVLGDMRGVASHGSVRLPRYHERLQAGLINKDPDVRADVDLPALLHIDGDNGLGQIVASKAMDMAIERAAQNGSCTVSIRNTNHMGILRFYALKATARNMIATVMCNTPPFVAAFGGAAPIIGTNPVCWALPAPEFPIVMDMAISPARGKIKNAADAGKPIPPDWAVDKDGKPTTSAKDALEGTLLPVGGVKGSGIGLIVEMMTGILSGGNFCATITHPLDDFTAAPDLGNYIHVIDVSKLMPVGVYMNRMAEYTAMVKGSKKAQGVAEIFMPGEIEDRKEKDARKNGLAVDDAVYAKLAELAKG